MTPVETVEAFVAAFVEAWPRGDATPVASFFSEDAEYHNGPLPPVRGREAIRAALAEFMAMGGRIDVDMAHIVTDGPIVMTERIDYVVTGERTVSLPVMGIFEVHDGAITAWRDYFDLSEFTGGWLTEPATVVEDEAPRT